MIYQGKHSYHSAVYFNFVKGFSLVELLVAMAVMAIGIAGAIATQATAKRDSVDAGQRSSAMIIAHDMLERIRLNPTQVVNYQGTQYGTADFTITTPVACDNSSTCTSAELAGYDKQQWHLLLSKGQINHSEVYKTPVLLKPTGCVEYNNGLVTVVVSWLSRDSTEDAANLNSAFAQGCGQASNQRRQVVYTSYL
ncbi:type IV pilus modification protein PilV [Catenovulum sp. 2E275]|uniref:type IV pilus modification protein PilV n=1 Tax=Catenovulum sp. 2E275 TaxID=2980497 RepID=UPI0021D184E1|nr:type IV pilus modification protein PilV [Catenovulum sp. 2E275]MCU4676282.1 type IV pilus modification protein PilV [Catenovulum sp. 2E275]